VLFSFQLLVAEKRALIVAIGKYPVASGWHTINSENDVPIIKNALIKQGFKMSNIDVLLNQQATKAGVMKAFDNVLSKSNPGDIVVFHFSGHGQQVTDISGDEADGLDEALIAYNASKSCSAIEPDGRYHLLDDEVGIFLNKLRKRVGERGDVLFFIDACHSGTATRSESTDVVRGTDSVFSIPGYKSTNNIKDETCYSRVTEVTRGVAASKGLSPYIVLSACLAGQTNKEYNKCGSLSFALGKVLSSNLNNKTYQYFFDAIRAEMLPLMVNSFGVVHDQTPQIEGLSNRMLFAGMKVNITPHFRVNEVKGRKILVNAGQINGVFKGAELSFYPAGTKDKSKSQPFLTCKVDTSSLTECVMLMNTDINLKKLMTSLVFVSKYRYRTYSHEDITQMRARVLRTLPINPSELAIKMIPLIDGKRTDVSKKMRNGNIFLKYGDKFTIQVSNKSKTPLYFQLIDVMANNQINLLTSNFSKYKDDYFLNPGQTKVLEKDIILIDPGSPLGQEDIVIVASETPLDLTAIETQNPTMKRAEISDFEQWINDFYTDVRSVPVFDSKKVYTNKLSFIVREK